MTRMKTPMRAQIPEVLRGIPMDKKMSTNKSVREKLATPVPKSDIPLTKQEWDFVKELVNNFGEITLKEAAIRAGYPEDKAKTWAGRMTDPKIMPHVVAAIQEYREEINQTYGTTYERHMRDMMRIRDAAMAAGNYGAAVAAEFRRGQALGTVYIERKEVRVGAIDSMSKAEVAAELQRLKDTYGTPPRELIDITPEKITQQLSVDDEAYSGD